MDEAIYDGKRGVEWAKENGDDLVGRYLATRVNVLTTGLQAMKSKFPDLMY